MIWQMTDVKLNVFVCVVLCDPHAREMLLSFPAACDACDARCCSLPAATLCHCSAAQVQLVVLCNHRIRLHCCTLPGLLLKLAWLGLKSSNFLCLFVWWVSVAWVSLAWVAWVPRSNKYYSWKRLNLQFAEFFKFTSCSGISPLDEERLANRSSKWEMSVFMKNPNNNSCSHWKSLFLGRHGNNSWWNKGPVCRRRNGQAHVDSITHILTPWYDTSLYLALILCVVIISHVV